MAIYKPSNCAPFLSAKDLTQPFSISCELNTSNERVTGYKLKILDSLNNTVFEGKQFDPIDPITSGNTGLNGSVLTLPVVIDGDGTLNHNTIQYNKETKAYTVTTGNGEPEFHASLFKNGYPNQPYKWIITLAQGQEKNGEGALEQRPTNPKYFDMEITSGTVLGSTPNRIQSYLSENIQKDYFIQLVDNNEQPIKNSDDTPVYRQLITSYDYTYGYIYPQENKFTKDNIEKATYFQIYKFGNDPDVVSASSKVVLKTDTKMQDVKFENKIASEVWGTGSETYPYYFTQKYTGFASKPNIGSFPCSAFDSSVNGDLVVGSTIIVSGEDQQKYNGVFTLQSFKVDEVKTKNGDTETTTYDLTVQWLRAATADTWAELVNNVYLVELGRYASQRFQVQVGENETGTINVNNVVFIPEKPVVLYNSYGFDVTNGAIFKNYSTYGIPETPEYITTYIRPFDGITVGQNFNFWEDNEYKPQFIRDIDYKTWMIYTVGSDRKTAFIPDETKYKITSFFKSSEENPFYAYADPTVEITSDFVTEEKGNTTYYKDSNGVFFYFDKGVAKNEEGKEIENPIFVIDNRLATLNGIFSQDNNKSWAYYQWRMTDLTIGTETTTEKGFDGEIAWTIYGLQNEHYYQVELYIQDEFGRVASKEITFQVQVKISEKKPFFEVEFDCETNSYKINTTSTGVVIPGLENRILITKISGDETNYQFFTVQEEQTGDFVTTDGAEVQVTGPFGTIRDLLINLGGSTDAYNYILLKAEKRIKNTTGDDTFEAIKGYNAGYNYNPEDKSYSLYVTDLDKPATSSDNLFFYNKMEGDSGGKSLIPAPKNDTITINFSNILNNYFEGQVMSYHIGVDSPSTAFNDIEVRVSVTPEIITPKETGLKEVSPDRNKIKVGIYQCLKTTNEDKTTTHKPDALIREKEFVFYGNPNTRKICSPWVDPTRGAASPNCDYIETDVVYNKDGEKIEGGLNINGEGMYNSSGEIVKPITINESFDTPNTYAVWYDKTTEILNQADGSIINYFTDNWNWWNFPRDLVPKLLTLPIDKSFAGYGFWEVEIDVEPNTVYTFSRENANPITINGGSYLGIINQHITPSGGNSQWLNHRTVPGLCHQNVQITSSVDGKLWIFFSPGAYNKWQNYENPFGYLQLEKGSTVTFPYPYYWNDQVKTESPIYRQTSINLPDDSHTGEEIFTDKNLTFSLILSDYNTATKQFAPLEINGKLWNGDEEVPLTEITK